MAIAPWIPIKSCTSCVFFFTGTTLGGVDADPAKKTAKPYAYPVGRFMNAMPWTNYEPLARASAATKQSARRARQVRTSSITPGTFAIDSSLEKRQDHADELHPESGAGL